MGDGLPALSLSASSISEERVDKREALPLIDSAHWTATRTRVTQRNRDRTRSLSEVYRAQSKQRHCERRLKAEI